MERQIAAAQAVQSLRNCADDLRANDAFLAPRLLDRERLRFDGLVDRFRGDAECPLHAAEQNLAIIDIAANRLQAGRRFANKRIATVDHVVDAMLRVGDLPAPSYHDTGFEIALDDLVAYG